MVFECKMHYRGFLQLQDPSVKGHFPPRQPGPKGRGGNLSPGPVLGEGAKPMTAVMGQQGLDRDDPNRGAGLIVIWKVAYRPIEMYKL